MSFHNKTQVRNKGEEIGKKELKQSSDEYCNFGHICIGYFKLVWLTSSF